MSRDAIGTPGATTDPDAYRGPDPVSLPITVTVRGRPQAVTPDGLEQIVTALATAVGDLLTDLSVPAEAAIEIRAAVESADRPLLEVACAGRRCRLPFKSVVDPPQDPADLAAEVADAILRSPDSLITDGVLETLSARWSGTLDDRPRKAIATSPAYLRALARHGLRLDRALGFAADAAGRAPEEVAAALEITAGGVDTVRVEVALGPGLHARLADSGGTDTTAGDPGEVPAPSLTEQLDSMRLGIFDEWGLMVPPVTVARDPDVGAESYRFRFNDLRLRPQDALSPGELMVNDEAHRIRLIALEARPTVNPANGSRCSVVAGATVETVALLERAGLVTWDTTEHLMLALGSAIRRRAGMLINADHVSRRLDELAETEPALVTASRALIPSRELVRALRALLESGISIRDLHGILEALVEARCDVAADSPITTGQMVAVRSALSRNISALYASDAELNVVVVDPMLERRVDDPEPIGAAEHDGIVAAFGRELAPAGPGPVVLTLPETRSRIARLIEIEFPDTLVLSYADLGAHVRVRPLGEVRWVDREEP